MPRHPEPLFYVQWREIAAKIPRICHTCDSYSVKGLCEKFDIEPPEVFASTELACESWELEIGF